MLLAADVDIWRYQAHPEVWLIVLVVVGFGWWVTHVVGPKVVQITTPRAIGRWPDIEFYRIDGQVLTTEEGNRLLQRIRHEVGEGKWATDEPGAAIYFDAASRCLIVRQSQTVQREIEALLSEASRSVNQR